MRYAYRHKETGEVVWVERTLAEGPPEQVVQGDKVYKRSYQDEQRGAPKGGKAWPMECWASGVNAVQAQDLRDEFKRVNVPTEVTKDGNPIYTSAAHRRRALKARGFIDRSSYY